MSSGETFVMFGFVVVGFISLPVYPKAICILWWSMVLVENARNLWNGWGFQENRQEISFDKKRFYVH